LEHPTIWDSGIPDTCKSCIIQARENGTPITKYFAIDSEDAAEEMDSYLGLSRVDNLRRQLVEDVTAVDDGRAVSRTITNFSCINNK